MMIGNNAHKLCALCFGGLIMKELALYIHIPFCKSKCYYCDFNSFSNKNDFISDYIDYLIREIRLYSNKAKDYSLKTIFIGGGTPSFIKGEYIYRLLEEIYKVFNINTLEEISIELNPKTVDDEKLKLYKEIGINRVSVGVQSLKDHTLKKIGRIHKSKDFFETYELLRKIGFSNINVDLISGLPGQTKEDILSTLEIMNDLEVDHISFYSLIIEEGTKFYNWYNNGKLILPDEEEERDMYHEGIKYLKSKGYNHYEISNLAKEGYECMHNLFYWKLKPYIGIGTGSHSNIEGLRYWNFTDFNKYFNSISRNELPIEGNEVIDKTMEMAEYTILGLRLIDGIYMKDFFRRFNISIKEVYGDILNKHFKNGLLNIEGDNIRLTEKGLDLSNLIFVDLIP